MFAAVPGGVGGFALGSSTYEPNQFVCNLQIEKLGLANKLVWKNKETLNSTATTTFSLFRTTMDETSREYKEDAYKTLLTNATNNYASTNICKELKFMKTFSLENLLALPIKFLSP